MVVSMTDVQIRIDRLSRIMCYILAKTLLVRPPSVSDDQGQFPYTKIT